ncbi:JmjC domain-containing protein [Nocardia sp. NPDC052566]|uniref:JmjC domain-containing protein n=1 Tax=Nocardia sp. NPDC052566 TaxID=3364330 RepID=UPI0037C85B02
MLDLDEWFAPGGLAEFARTRLGRTPFVAAARPDLARRLGETLGIRSAGDLFALRAPEVTAWLNGLDGGLTAAPVPIGSAQRLHAAGTTLLFKNIHEFGEHERAIAGQLGLAARSAMLQVFCNRQGAGTRIHFDPLDVISVQLTGRKTWRIAPNDACREPLEGWAPGEDIYPRMRTYVTEVLPTAMPAGATEYVLEPGAVLHVPRGYWHETSSDRDSISLHLLLVPPLRMDLLITALRNELARYQEWREPMYEAGAGDVAADLPDFRSAVARLDAMDLRHPPRHAHPVGTDTRFVRAGQAMLGIDAVADGSAGITVTAYGLYRNHTASIEMSADFLPACRWVNDLPTGSTLDVADLLLAAPQLTKSEVGNLLGILEQTRLIRRQ